MPPPIGVVGGVRRVAARWPQLLLQGEAPNRRGPGWLPLRQGSPGEDSLEEIHVRPHPEDGLIDGDEAGNVQHPSRIEVLQLQAPLIEELMQELVRGVS